MPGERVGRHDCAVAREALSAGLDGEATRAEQAAADAHLAGCPECRRWWDDAAVLTRRVRTAAAVAAPDVTAAVLPAAPGRRRVRVARGMRVALAVIGVSQLVLAVAQIGTAAGGGHVPGFGGVSVGHLGHESGAWSLGLAAGFLWVAARRSRPSAILPILVLFIGYVVLLNAGDLVAGRVGSAHVATHTVEVAGFVIVLGLSRLTRHDPPPSRMTMAGNHRAAPADFMSTS